jgi:spermidine synthase
VRYYEINPEVIDVAEGSQPYFTFVKDSAADVTTVLGDARLSLERELAETGSQRFDLLVMDAFSGDSVPMHLITEEAFRVYAAHLKTDDSILAVNVSNRYLDLEPVVTANAQALGFYSVRVDTKGDPPVVMQSSWILLTRDVQVILDRAILAAGGRPLRGRSVLFTDKYSNLFRVLK